MTAERDTHLDAARGLAILLVVFGHLLEPAFMEQGRMTDGLAFRIWQVVYAFHMPLFFLLAGMTDSLARDGRPPAALAGALKLVLTAFAFSLLASIPRLLAGSLTVTQMLADHVCGGSFGLAPLWFLIVLAQARCVYAAACATAGNAAFWGCLALVLAVSGACAALEIGFWHLHSLFGALPFYVLGRLSGVRGLKASATAATCGLASLLILSPGNLVHLAAGHYGRLPIFAACALGGSCCVLALVARLRGTALAAAARLGRRSFELFIVNGIVLAVSPTMRQLDGAAGLLLLAAIGIPSQIALAALLRRPIAAVRRAVDAGVALLLRRGAAPLAA